MTKLLMADAVDESSLASEVLTERMLFITRHFLQGSIDIGWNIVQRW
jgi:hypothetical protein